MKANPPLLALAVGAFGIGVTEFAPMGMLPIIAQGVGVSIPAAGLLISAYAFGVVVAAPLVVLAGGGLSRRTLLIALMAVFTAGNILAALSTTYELLLVARLVTSLNHGAFFGVGAVVAAGLASPDRRAAAVAAMFTGLTVATVVGVPLATWAGAQIGWRAVFAATAGIGALAMAALALNLPRSVSAPSASALSEMKVLIRGPVLAALGLTVVSASAMFTVFTYITPILLEETGVSIAYVTAMLVIYGVGLTIGNWVGGVFADRSVDRTLIISLAAMAAILTLFAWGMASHWITPGLILLWGVASFAVVPPLQMRVMAAAADAPNLASAVNIGAFNLGNAIGAALGAWVIATGFGLPAVALAGAAAATAGLLVFLLSLLEITPRVDQP